MKNIVTVPLVTKESWYVGMLTVTEEKGHAKIKIHSRKPSDKDLVIEVDNSHGLKMVQPLGNSHEKKSL